MGAHNYARVNELVNLICTVWHIAIESVMSNVNVIVRYIFFMP